MHTQLHQRLTELKREFEAGQKMLADLEEKKASLRDTMLRISGAIQVLEELIKAEEGSAEHGGAAAGGGVAERVSTPPA